MKSPVFNRLFSYLRAYRGPFAVAVTTGLIGTLFTILAPKLLGDITTLLYDGVKDGLWTVRELADGTPDPASVVVYSFGKHLPLGKLSAIGGLSTAVLALYVLSFLFCGSANKILARIASDMVRDLRRDIDEKMHRMKLGYYDTRTNGEILSVVTNDVDAVNTLLGKNFYTVVTSAFTLVGVLAMLLSISVWIGLVAVAMIPATLLVSGPVMKMGAKNFAAQQNLLGAVNGYVEEIYGGQNVVSSFNRQGKAIERFDALNAELREKAKKAESFTGTVMPLSLTVNNIGYAAAALIGCLFAIKGRITVGNVQSALQYVKNFQQPFTAFSQMAGQLSAAVAACGRIFALLDAEEEVPEPAEGKVPAKNDGAVEFRHVRFGYTPEKPLMRDVSIRVEPGWKAAIVGPTGAGKTTLVNLLMRFYEIDGGVILVDGLDTREMTRHELRKHFGMVLQDTWLFEGTIRDNLKYGAGREVSDEEIEAAAKSVCADSFIRTMPGGYDMMLSKGAENVSQGQRQLLTIARAIVADPEIMILDEATSNVDAHTEQVIQNAMATLMKGRTSFVIAHRLSTIRDANVILYMENGDIKEVGDHDELLARGGKYAELYNSQFG
jgi:ATP-binding cassette subfamily B protein